MHKSDMLKVIDATYLAEKARVDHGFTGKLLPRVGLLTEITQSCSWPSDLVEAEAS